MQNLSNQKTVIIILGGLALILASILFWIGVGSILSDKSSGLSDDRAYSQGEIGYLEEMDTSSNTFATEEGSLEFGFYVCDQLDEYYLTSIEDDIARDRTSALRGVDWETKEAGIIAAGNNLCPEHLPEITRWAR